MIQKTYHLRSVNRYSLVEMLAVMTVLSLLFAMGIPTFKEMRAKAKFVRWSAYNAQWNRDPDCMVNYNIQEGKGNILRNGAESSDWRTNFRSFNPRDYDGRFSSLDSHTGKLTDKTNGFSWGIGGRWGRYKKSIQFKKGINTVVQIGRNDWNNTPVARDAVLSLADGNVYGISYVNNASGAKTPISQTIIDPQRDALDFTPMDSFTIIAWVKFGDESGGLGALQTNYQCIFSRANWGVQNVVDPGNASYSSAQYDLYTDIKSSGNIEGSFDVDAFTLCPGYSANAVNFKDASWKQVAMRYSYPPPPIKGSKLNSTENVYRCVDVFYNGKLQAGKRVTYNTTANGSRAKSSTLLLGGVQTTYNGGLSFPFEGRMDEFMVFRKALPDHQIYGDYLMGSE